MPAPALGVVSPAAPRTNRGPSAGLVKVAGLALFLATLGFVVAGPFVMSPLALAAIQAGLILCGAVYGLFLVGYQSRGRVDLERVYSAHLEELSQRLRNMAYRDALTGLYNHRYFYEQLSHEVERSARYGQPLAVLLLDLDNFKEINDTCGHLAGDKFLTIVGETIARQIRASDIGARYGGDEFVVILPNTSSDEAMQTAEKLDAAVAAAASMSGVAENVKLGISIGVASCPTDSKAPGELLQIADKRLYRTKEQRKATARRGHAPAA